MAATRSLLDDSDDDVPETTTLQVNQEFARRFEHNKKREDLHRLQEMQKQGRVDSDSDSESGEEDEDGVWSEDKDMRIFDTLAKIKKRDPDIYKPDVKYFSDEEEDGDDEEDRPVKNVGKPKKVYLKDVTGLQGNEGSDDDGNVPKRSIKTYKEEQKELKDEFLKGLAEAENKAEVAEEDDLFKAKKKSQEEVEEVEKPIARPLTDYFGEDDALNENDKFLKDFLLNQGWIDKKGTGAIDLDEVSEDEEELDQQDLYEAKYNFRFEEGAGSQVLGHSRVVENSVRKLSDKRKEQRKRKKERISEAENARREEIKRLKNVKRREILEKIEQIKSIAGSSKMEEIAEDYLEADFDPEAHDEKMKAAFDEKYYEQEDPDVVGGGDDESDEEKPDFDAEDEALGLEKGWDGRPPEVNHGRKRGKGTALPSAAEKEIEKYMEAYRNVDFEGAAGKFKYTQVKPDMYGLSTAQILDADDKELNQHISLKFLAPYRTDEPVPRHKFNRISKKERKRQAMDQVPTFTNKKQKVNHDGNGGEVSKKRKKNQVEVDGGDGGNRGNDGEGPSKKRKKDQVEADGGNNGADAEGQAVTKKKKSKQQGDDGTKVKGDVEKREVTMVPTKNEEKDEAKDKQATTESEPMDAVDGNGDGNADAPRKKKGRSRKNKGLGLSQNRLLSYGKIQPPKRKKF